MIDFTFSRAKALVVAASFGAVLLASTAANANVILTFGQVGNGNTVTGTQTGSTTSITTTNTAVTITQIDGSVTTPINAYLTLNLTSTSLASTIAGYITEDFSGTFSIRSAINGGGVNYLSGSLVDVALGQNAAFTLTASTPAATNVMFTSDVIANLGLDRGASFSFANVTPGLRIVNNTIGSFGASVSGTFSGNPIPEPVSMGLLGTGLLGLGLVRRRAKAA